MTVLLVLAPLSREARPVRPAISAHSVFFIFEVFPLVPAPLGKDKGAIPVFLIVSECASVSVAASERDGAEPVHFVVAPVTHVDASLGEARHPVTVALSIQEIAFVKELLHFAPQRDSGRA